MGSHLASALKLTTAPSWGLLLAAGLHLRLSGKAQEAFTCFMHAAVLSPRGYLDLVFANIAAMLLPVNVQAFAVNGAISMFIVLFVANRDGQPARACRTRGVRATFCYKYATQPHSFGKLGKKKNVKLQCSHPVQSHRVIILRPCGLCADACNSNQRIRFLLLF